MQISVAVICNFIKFCVVASGTGSCMKLCSGLR
jgi:hypothetical protein